MKAARIKYSLSFKRTLVDLNIILDGLNDLIDSNGWEYNWARLSAASLELGLPVVVVDILILEDRRFFRHRGVELRAIPRAIRRYFRYGRLGGVSTVEQLLVRTFLQRRERTVTRKAREASLAVILNLHRSKLQILSAYVNCAYFGPMLNGIESASAVCFGRPPDELSLDQSGFLASLLPYPIPPNVSHVLRERGPQEKPEDILEIGRTYDNHWNIRVSRRMKYLESLRPKYSEAVLRGRTN